MIDINIIRETPDLVKATLEARGYPQNWVDEILEHDTQWRKYRHEENILREKRNEISKLIPSLSASEKAEKIAEMKEHNKVDFNDVHDAMKNLIPSLEDDIINCLTRNDFEIVVHEEKPEIMTIIMKYHSMVSQKVSG